MSEEGREMLIGRYTWTETGDPLTLREARAEFGPRLPHRRPGWFWIAATPASAARIRTNGHHAVGTAVTTWIPPQTAITLLDLDDGPPPGSLQ